jgi:hypothetical protein
VALTNLTGMEFVFDPLALQNEQMKQIQIWQKWSDQLLTSGIPSDIQKLLLLPQNTAKGRPVSASTTYKGPPGVLTDGRIGPEYWQTKNVAPPQWCLVDLGDVREASRVVVHQYGPRFVMNDYEIAVSEDGKDYEVVRREKGASPVTLTCSFPPRAVRFVKVTSFGSVNSTYPTTFFEVEVNKGDSKSLSPDQLAWRLERGLRALGALGGEDDVERVLSVLGDNPPFSPEFRPATRAGIRSLGRLGGEKSLRALIAYLDNPLVARYAADALGDLGDERAVEPLLSAYTRYAKTLTGQDPKDVPPDDHMTFPSEDRMLETPYWIVYALCRLPLDDRQTMAQLRRLSPQLIANLPGDHDTFFLYEPEVAHLLTTYLLDQCGMRQEVCEQAFIKLGQPRRVAASTPDVKWPEFPAYRIGSWLPAVCTESDDVPRLLALLQHEEGFVRLNAAKSLAWIGDRKAIRPIAEILIKSKPEAEHGYSGVFKNEEYNDPAPRWREGLIRALGILDANEHASVLAKIMNDDRNVLEIRHAAAQALADLDTDEATQFLMNAAQEHDFHSVQQVARDAIRFRGLTSQAPIPTTAMLPKRMPAAAVENEQFEAIVFIKGDNNIPNTIGTVEQADRWRATYAVTDSGPAYRPGKNLYLLRPPTPDGQVTPLTSFIDGYVAEPELSWDGQHVLFSHRGADDPWWQVYRINIDGSGLEQLTFGPYHHVGPTYLPDGRIILASSRSGMRDEYHGYPCTALYVMNADGSELKPIATNIGRDNEPAVLWDGRVVFSRLEVFYSRNKTELTLHAAHPDGTQDVVLYGPERRKYWRQLNHGPPTPADGQEAPLTHRVLRMTQPQPMPNGRDIVVVTQGGLVLVGANRLAERHITPDYRERSYTTPYPLPDGTILCASTWKEENRANVDLGLYLLDPDSGALHLVYNDPRTADFEPRPIFARRRPPTIYPHFTEETYSCRFACASAFHSQLEEVRERGRYVRLIEGVPVVARHSTHTNDWEVWKNHGGTFARILGVAPLAADGSFYVEAPADRLLHFQVLDSDRRVMGNQLTWIYARPGETKSCVGCHEHPHATTRVEVPHALRTPPLKFLPRPDDFTYRAKAWFKGHLPSEIEERTRTTRAVSLLAR